MLVGRAPERARVDRLLEEARGGRSGSLLLVGEAGIGKTALLKHALAEAARAGLLVLRARGMQSESDIPFAGLSELLAPVLDRLDAIPATQGAALRGALALGDSAAHDRFAVPAGVLSLLASAAEERPVLVALDDAQWLDRSSLEAVLFAGRRLGAEGIALLLSVRAAAGADGLDAWLERLEIGPLGADDARALLASARGERLAGPVAERLVAGAAGNPLALLEIPTLLSDAQLAGREPLASPLRPGTGIKRAFRRRVDQLPEPTRRALLVAAASEAAQVHAVLAGMRELGLAADALEPAEAAELVRVDGGRIDFRHPLLRSTAYYAATAAERRAAHRALAGAAGAGSAERAWHLASAAVAPARGGRRRARGGRARRPPARRHGHRRARFRARCRALPRRRPARPPAAGGGGRRRRRRRGRPGARPPRRGRGAHRGPAAALRAAPAAREHPDPHRARPGRLPCARGRGRRRARHRPAAGRRHVPRGVGLPHEHGRHGLPDRDRGPGTRPRGGPGPRAGAALRARDRRGLPRARRDGRGRGAARRGGAVPARRRRAGRAGRGARHGRPQLDLDRALRPRGGRAGAARAHLPRRERGRVAHLPPRRAGPPRPAPRPLEPGRRRGRRVAHARRADRTGRPDVVQPRHPCARARPSRPRGGDARRAGCGDGDDRAHAGARGPHLRRWPPSATSSSASAGSRRRPRRSSRSSRSASGSARTSPRS